MKLLSSLYRLYVRYYLYWMWRVGLQRAIIMALLLGASLVQAAKTNKMETAIHPIAGTNQMETVYPIAGTNQVAYGQPLDVKAEEKAEKEKKTEHTANKIIVKAREKGSTKESDWKTEREFPLMFGNNRKARTPKDK